MSERIQVTRATLPPLEDYIEEIRSIWDSHWLTNMGEKHERLRNELKKYMEVPELELFVNGHMALEMIIQAFSLKGEVITTPFTFASTTHAIVRNGLKPVFCDINDRDYTIDADKIEDLITDRTSAIVPVHVYGNICDVEKIEEIAARHNLKVIYDAAHTFGETYKGVGIGNYGDASIFSFHATKVYNSIEGGCVTYADPKIGEVLYNLKNFGIRGPESVVSVGANAKMNEFQAAMGLCNLKYVEDNIAKRKAIYEAYKERLEDINGIILWSEQEDVRHNYAYLPIFIDKDAYGKSRDDVFDLLESENIGARKYFYPITCDFEAYKEAGYNSDCPVARKMAGSVITLPIYPELTEDDADRICRILRHS